MTFFIALETFQFKICLQLWTIFQVIIGNNSGHATQTDPINATPLRTVRSDNFWH